MHRSPLSVTLLLVGCFGLGNTGFVAPPASAAEARGLFDRTRPAVLASGSNPVALDAPPPRPRSVSAKTPRCPAEMALVERPRRAFCVDRFEASLVRRDAGGALVAWPANRVVDGHEHEMVAVSAAGHLPQGYVSGMQASFACANAGKRLCEADEWLEACRGPRAQTYPYGSVRRPGVCNDRFKSLDEHPVAVLFKRFAEPGTDPVTMWHSEWMNDPRLFELPHTVEPTGSHPECKSDDGAYDMVGNLHEWVSDPQGTFLGGYFMDTLQNGEGCGYRTRAHDFTYHDYSTGFRCCRDTHPA